MNTSLIIRASAAHVPAHPPRTTKRLHKALQVAIKRANLSCKKNGNGSAKCRVAWDAVCEIEHAYYDTRTREAEYDPLEEFCDITPEADECRTYDM